MIPNDQPARKQMLTRMLDHLNSLSKSSFSKWEEDFIKSVDDQFQAKGDLSQKQAEIIERLYDKE